MDLGPPLLSVCVMMICLLGAARSSIGDKIDCTCPAILPMVLTDPPPVTCFEINNRFRYKCVGGYTRKAGTSDLIICKQTEEVVHWTPSPPTLQCIPDPKITKTQPPTPTVTKGHTDIPHDSIITTTVTAASTSLQMTQSISTSASVTAETESPQLTSPGVQIPSNTSQDLRGTKETDGITSTSTTTEPSNNGTVNPRVSSTKFSSTTTVILAFAPLLIICVLIGIGLSYRRRSRRNIPQHTREELILMNDVPSVLAS